MQGLRFTLVADGSSDKALLPILVWLLREHFGRIPVQPEFADLRRLRNPPGELSERIARSIELYPCDLLFVHRDAERESIEQRVMEIREALERCMIDTPPIVYVVPVRMQEAWLLIDESALRKAAGNPQGPAAAGRAGSEEARRPAGPQASPPRAPARGERSQRPSVEAFQPRCGQVCASRGRADRRFQCVARVDGVPAGGTSGSCTRAKRHHVLSGSRHVNFIRAARSP